MNNKDGWKPGHFIKKGIEKVKGDSPPEQQDMSSLTPTNETPDKDNEAVAVSSAAAEMGNGEQGSNNPPLSAMPMLTATSEPFYLNVVVVDSSAAVAQQVLPYSRT